MASMTVNNQTPHQAHTMRLQLGSTYQVATYDPTGNSYVSSLPGQMQASAQYDSRSYAYSAALASQYPQQPQHQQLAVGVLVPQNITTQAVPVGPPPAYPGTNHRATQRRNPQQASGPPEPFRQFRYGAPVAQDNFQTSPPAYSAAPATTQTANAPFAARKHWKPDSSSGSCKVCHKDFSWYWRRRHHCRQCGELVCWKCSGHRMATFIPGCETVGRVRVCSLCALKRQSEDFSWERELAGYFGVEVARRGARLMSEHHTWNRQPSVVSGMRVTVHRFSNADEDEREEHNAEEAKMEAARLGKPSAARPTKSQAAFWVRETTKSHAHFTNPRTDSEVKRGEAPSLGDAVVDLGECPICQFELTEPAGTSDYQLPKNCDPSHSLGNDPDAIVTINQCGHNFHAACVGKWLKDHTTCPMCRENAFKNVKGK